MFRSKVKLFQTSTKLSKTFYLTNSRLPTPVIYPDNNWTGVLQRGFTMNSKRVKYFYGVWWEFLKDYCSCNRMKQNEKRIFSGNQWKRTYSLQADGRLDGWEGVERRVDGWRDGWTDGWRDGWTEQIIDTRNLISDFKKKSQHLHSLCPLVSFCLLSGRETLVT